MRQDHWNKLIDITKGETLSPLPVGFIIDSPWLPNWFGITKLDYYSNDELWLNANLKVFEEFPEVMFFPSFWAEYGMCTEPSAFGAKSIFPLDEFPHANKIIHDISDIDHLNIPNPKTDGLLPFMLNRLRLNHDKIRDQGYDIRFAIARGPLNIASYLMGTTELLTTMMMEPDKVHVMLRKITAFLKEWLDLQATTFKNIDGIILLDDIIGFIGENEFKEFGMPYFKELYQPDVSIKFLHNDASCESSVAYYPEIGINLFNMAFDTDLNELKKKTKNKVTMLGNIPPRDVLASGSPDNVRKVTTELLNSSADKSRIIYSCGGGMPPGVSSENLRAFIDTVNTYSS